METRNLKPMHKRRDQNVNVNKIKTVGAKVAMTRNVTDALDTLPQNHFLHHFKSFSSKVDSSLSSGSELHSPISPPRNSANDCFGCSADSIGRQNMIILDTDFLAKSLDAGERHWFREQVCQVLVLRDLESKRLSSPVACRQTCALPATVLVVPRDPQHPG